MTSKLPRWRLKSSASRLFTRTFVQAQIKENIKAPRHWPLWRESTGNRWIPLTKGQLRGKCSYLMTLSWEDVVRPGTRRSFCLLMAVLYHHSHNARCFSELSPGAGHTDIMKHSNQPVNNRQHCANRLELKWVWGLLRKTVHHQLIIGNKMAPLRPDD